MAALGLNTACGQQDFENKDVNGFSELIADTNVVVLDVRTASEFERDISRTPRTSITTRTTS